MKYFLIMSDMSAFVLKLCFHLCMCTVELCNQIARCFTQKSLGPLVLISDIFVSIKTMHYQIVFLNLCVYSCFLTMFVNRHIYDIRFLLRDHSMEIDVQYIVYRLIHEHFHIGLVIIPRPPYWPETASWANMGRGMITRPIWKCPCIKLFITYFRHLEKRHPYWSETKLRPEPIWASIWK